MRDLRVQRGLTQAELAGKDFSTGFISLLETGRTRVSLRAAGILAQRLGVSVSDLMANSSQSERSVELLMLRGEQMLAAGNPAEAVESIRAALAQASGALRARALRAQGRALVELGQPRDALRPLEEATHAFEALGQRELASRTLYDRAFAHARLDEPGNALTLAIECETSMRARGIVDRTLELQLRSLLAAIFARAGDNESADLQAQRALSLADDVVDAQALASLYSTLAVTRQREGDLDAALGYARRSLQLYEELRRQHEVGQLWHNLAAIYLTRKDYAETEKALTRAERIAKESKLGSLEARLLSLRAQLATAQRQSEQARKFAQAAADHPAASARTKGKALLTLARLAASRKAPLAEARKAMEGAIKAYGSEPPRVRAEAHEAYAEMLAERGEWKAAYGEAKKTLELHRPTFR